MITADLSELKDLVNVLDRASQRPHKERARALEEEAAQAEGEARATVATYDTKSTGELAGAIYRMGTAVSQVIGADVRQAHFLETGSPNTGAARPWLSDPAEQAQVRLVGRLGQVGELW